jgi:aspartate/methionine/tyrosine aminotransferase
MPPEFLIENMR